MNSIASSSANMDSASPKWLHSFVPHLGPNLLDNAFCKNIIESVKRRKFKPIQMKTSTSNHIIKHIIEKVGLNTICVTKLRIAVLCTLRFSGFFYYNELKYIQPKNIEFYEDYTNILVPRSNTDIYHVGNCANNSENNYCPVATMLSYIRAAKLQLDSTAFSSFSFPQKQIDI